MEVVSDYTVFGFEKKRYIIYQALTSKFSFSGVLVMGIVKVTDI